MWIPRDQKRLAVLTFEHRESGDDGGIGGVGARGEGESAWTPFTPGDTRPTQEEALGFAQSFEAFGAGIALFFYRTRGTFSIKLQRDLRRSSARAGLPRRGTWSSVPERARTGSSSAAKAASRCRNLFYFRPDIK